MTPYEIIILLAGFGAVVFLAGWNISRLKSKLESEHEYRARLEERIAKLEEEDADNVPNGYLFKDFVDNIQAHNIAMQEHARVQRELLHQLRRGNVRIDKKNNGT